VIDHSITQTNSWHLQNTITVI